MVSWGHKDGGIGAKKCIFFPLLNHLHIFIIYSYMHPNCWENGEDELCLNEK